MFYSAPKPVVVPANGKRYEKAYHVTDIPTTHPYSIVYIHIWLALILWKRAANTIYLSGAKSCLLYAMYVRYLTMSTIQLIASVYFISVPCVVASSATHTQAQKYVKNMHYIEPRRHGYHQSNSILVCADCSHFRLLQIVIEIHLKKSQQNGCMLFSAECMADYLGRLVFSPLFVNPLIHASNRGKRGKLETGAECALVQFRGECVGLFFSVCNHHHDTDIAYLWTCLRSYVIMSLVWSQKEINQLRWMCVLVWYERIFAT